MYDRSEFLDTIRSAQENTGLLCSSFQVSLSALLDGEIGEGHARQSLSHLEHCAACTDFFQAIRLQALAHKDWPFQAVWLNKFAVCTTKT